LVAYDSTPVALQLHAISILGLEHPDHEDCRSYGWTSGTHYFHIKACASEPWRLTSRWLNFICTTCLIKDSFRTGTHIVWTIAAIFPYLCFGKTSFDLSNIERRPDVFAETFRRMQPGAVRSISTQRKVQTESSRRPDE
jgi:hypothetical protein